MTKTTIRDKLEDKLEDELEVNLEDEFEETNSRIFVRTLNNCLLSRVVRGNQQQVWEQRHKQH